MSGRFSRWTPQLLYDRLHGPLAFLGLAFVVIVISERLVDPSEPIRSILVLAGWSIWGIFALEFGLRLYLADDRKRFLRQSWWQAILLILPFLNFIRILAFWRVTRMGRILSAGVRGSRSARSKLNGRIGWATGITLMITLVAADLLYELGGASSYADALHDASMATISGAPIEMRSPVADWLEVVLAAYSVVVFAALAGSVAAFFTERRAEETG